MPKSVAKPVQPTTTKLTLTLTHELKKALIKKAREMFGDRKGSISIFVEMELRKNLEMNLPGVEER